jgi:hypothetical protein
MLDILHYLFESDTLGEEETLKAKLKMRRTIYKVLYLRDYTWMEDDGTSYREFGTQDASGLGMGSTELTHKPYIPPTPVNADSPLPFGAALMPPLG